MVGICFQVNDWVLCIDENKLYRQEREVSAEPRLINLLHFLAEHAGEVFGREELIQHVWDGAIVTDQVVTQSIFELRKLLRDGREENLSYVVTVPKRGYKLVANVQRLDTNPYLSERQEPLINRDDLLDSQEDPRTSVVEVVFPAGPITRAVCQSQQQKKSSEPNVSRWRLGLLNALWIGLLIVAMGYFTVQQSQLRITQVVDAHLIEFKLQDALNAQDRADVLADGIAQKLMADLSQVSRYRVISAKATYHAGILPGKSIMVRINTQDGHQFLGLELKNNSSDVVLFSRQYPLESQHLLEVIKSAEWDVMQALKIPNAQQQAQRLLVDFPYHPTAAELYVRANHYLNLADHQKLPQGIDLLEQALKIEPNNHYVQAELLIAYHVQQAIASDPQLNQAPMLALSEQLQQVTYATGLVVQPRIYEALALQATINNQMDAATDYLAQAQALRESVLSYVLQGKHAELQGNMDGASDAYSEAFYMNTSLDTYLLCENLVFRSNLKSIDFAMYRSVHPSVVRLL